MPLTARMRPSFSDAHNLRQKARACGLDPDYWYPILYSSELKPRSVRQVSFAGTRIAVFRAPDGAVSALEDRCAHRQIELSLGNVVGCRLVCAYHGWAYSSCGVVEEIPHELFGRPMPRFKVRYFASQERYGYIWLFAGDSSKARERDIPEMPEMTGPAAWPYADVSFLWKSHHSMVLDNLNDLTHSFLHRDFRPFNDPVLEQYTCDGDDAHLLYRTRMVEGGFTRRIFDRDVPDADVIEIFYRYPYQWGTSGGRVKHRIFIVPVDDETTKVFFRFFFAPITIPFTRVRLPLWMMRLIVPLAKRFFVRPLLSQDGAAVQWELDGYAEHPDAPLAELNPCVPLFQKLLVRKWEEHLLRSTVRPYAERAAATGGS